MRDSLGYSEELYPDELLLAFIDVESDGDPYANRDGSKFYGLLQIGTSNGADFNFVPSSILELDPIEAGARNIRHFFRYMNRYQSRHDFEPYRMAILWKGGPGTARTYENLLEEGATPAQLNEFLDTVANADEYVRRFREDFRFWKSQSETVPTTTIEVIRNPEGRLLRSTAASTPGGCAEGGSAPLPEARTQTFDTDAVVRANGAKNASLAYLERSFIQNLSTYKEGVYVRYRTKNGFSERAYKQIAGFVDSAVSGEFELQFRALFDDAPFRWVRPLVDPVIGNSPWGKRRSFPARARDEGEKRAILRDPTTGEQLFRRHFGVDYATESNGRGRNQPCYAIADGEVIRAGRSRTYGLVIYLDHGNGVTSRYAHLAEFKVSRGDRVTKAQVIGITGASEGSTAPDGKGFVIVHNKIFPHLHFELRLNIGSLRGGPVQGSLLGNVTNISIDPEPLFSVCPNPGEVPKRLPGELQKAVEARDAAAELVDVATTPQGRVNALVTFDTASARLRAERLACATRKEFYDAQVASERAIFDRVAGRIQVNPSSLGTA